MEHCSKQKNQEPKLFLRKKNCPPPPSIRTFVAVAARVVGLDISKKTCSWQHTQDRRLWEKKNVAWHGLACAPIRSVQAKRVRIKSVFESLPTVAGGDALDDLTLSYESFTM